MRYRKPNVFCYRIFQAASFVVAKLIFKRKFLRNEIKGKKGPFVVIANHQAMLDFVNLVGATKTPMTFVISNSFYNTLPIKKFLDKLGVISKQQFQTTVSDMRDIKAVIEAGHPLVIYPAGLMCEDGLSTPIPSATYKFLKWLDCDVYVARTKGTYFTMPKWTKGMRRGRTYLDIYKLFEREELCSLNLEIIKEKTEEALLFDAYKEQEELKEKYAKNSNIEGLQNVLYICPCCKAEFSINVKNKNTIYCEKCGYELCCDEFGFLHKKSDNGNGIRYVSDWSKLVFETEKQKIRDGENSITAQTVIKMIDYKKHKFKEVGEGKVTLNNEGFLLRGIINGEEREIKTSIKGIPSLPFSPGKYLEIQNGKEIYRCVLNDGKLTMKFINKVKIFYEMYI